MMARNAFTTQTLSMSVMAKVATKLNAFVHAGEATPSANFISYRFVSTSV